MKMLKAELVEEIQNKGWDFFDAVCNLGLNRIDGNTANIYPLGGLPIDTGSEALKELYEKLSSKLRLILIQSN
jgi:hypothetical protein